MIYSGTAISVQALGDGIAEFKFDLANESVNKFNRATLEDLQSAINAVKADSSIKGMVVTSGKSVFIVDITEFVSSFGSAMLSGLTLRTKFLTALKIYLSLLSLPLMVLRSVVVLKCA